MQRRDFLRAGAGAGLAATLAPAAAAFAQARAAAPSPPQPAQRRYRHSVARWSVGRVPLAEVAREAERIGLESIELLEPADWAVVREAGLTCAVGYAPAGDPRTRLTRGWNRAEHHAWLLPGYQEGLRLAAAAGVPNVICFSGNRDGQDDEQGLELCAAGLRRLMPDAERLGVTVIMELLNSKVDHPDYQCDRTPWGVALVERVGSERFKLLYDVYHMQVMEGDVIRTIRDHHQHIAHYHIAGNPGRHEPDDTQELYYPAIMRALVEVGFTGFVAQEFIPTGEPLAALAEAVRICTV